MHVGRDNKEAVREGRMVIATGNLIRIDVTAAHGTLNHTVPDGSGSCDTNYIALKWRIVCISCPDANHYIGCITDRPVVLKVVGCAGFGCYLMGLSIGLLPIIKRKC